MVCRRKRSEREFSNRKEWEKEDKSCKRIEQKERERTERGGKYNKEGR